MTCTQSGNAAAGRFKGCWGGVAIVGSAPINFGGTLLPAAPAIAGRNGSGGGLQRLLEGTGGQPVGGGTQIDSLLFGGANPDDNSGVLRYVRSEYAGRVLTALGSNNELNGFTLGGVGRGTTIEFIQSHAGLDDGFELFGGTVNVRYYYGTANSDDDFDWSFGWQGSAQFLIVQKDSLDGDKGFEGDNSEGSGCTTAGCTGSAASFNETPRTNGPIYNATFIGKLTPANSGSPVTANGVNDMAHIRRGNNSQIANVIAIGWRSMLDLDDAPTCSNTATDPEIRNSALGGYVVLGNGDSGDPVCFRGATEVAVLTNASVNNISDAAVNTYASQLGTGRSPFDVQAPDFRPRAGTTLATTAASAPPASNTFIQTTSYIGAVEPASLTPNNLAWYMGWTRGWTTSSAP
jgi:hypothetical protein